MSDWSLCYFLSQTSNIATIHAAGEMLNRYSDNEIMVAGWVSGVSHLQELLWFSIYYLGGPQNELCVWPSQIIQMATHKYEFIRSIVPRTGKFLMKFQLFQIAQPISAHQVLT
jgi:hypothetical protein